MNQARKVILENLDLLSIDEAVSKNDLVIFKKSSIDAGMIGHVVDIKDGKAHVKIASGGALRIADPSDLVLYKQGE